MACDGTGQDGDLLPGVVWPVPRFVVNDDGTVKDNLTNLIWLKDANCFGTLVWIEAIDAANTLASGVCGLSDGSQAGDWHLASVNELQSLLDIEYSNPALSDAAGTVKWSEGDAFSGVQASDYWSSSSYATSPQDAWSVDLSSGEAHGLAKPSPSYVWPVRGPL
jgi:hypothetical protein